MHNAAEYFKLIFTSNINVRQKPPGGIVILSNQIFSIKNSLDLK